MLRAKNNQYEIYILVYIVYMYIVKYMFITDQMDNVLNKFIVTLSL